MQQRRLYNDDSRGMGEALNEFDSLGNPISVPAVYLFQLFNFAEEPSLQREAQLKQDDPLQYFFQFQTKKAKSVEKSSLIAKTQVKAEEFVKNKQEGDVFKVVLFPIEKNAIQIRIENIGDIFDSTSLSASSSATIDIYGLSASLYSSVNNGLSSLLQINI